MISIHKISQIWNNFFFKEESNLSVGFFRILWGIILFTYASQDLFNLNDFYGPKAILSLSSTLKEFPYPHLNIFQFIGVKENLLTAIMFIYVLSILFLIIGFKTKVSLIYILVTMVSFHQRNIWLLSSSEVLMRIITLYLLFSNAEKALSLDSYLVKKKYKISYPTNSNPWAFRLIQIQLSVVYLMTVWQKLKGDTWIDGTALYYATRLDQFKNFPVPYLFDSISFLKFGTWLTLLIEFSLGVFIWVKEARKYLIYGGILFHLMIEYSMSIPFFEYIMCILLLTHVTSSEYEFVIQKIKLVKGFILRFKFYKIRGTSPTAS